MAMAMEMATAMAMTRLEGISLGADWSCLMTTAARVSQPT